VTDAPRGTLGRVFRAANGRASFELDDWSLDRLMAFIGILQRHFDFDAGLPVPGLDDVTCRGAVRGVELLAGYDNWSGCYVMAVDAAGDAIVHTIAATFGLHVDDAGDQVASATPPAPARVPRPRPSRSEMPAGSGVSAPPARKASRPRRARGRDTAKPTARLVAREEVDAAVRRFCDAAAALTDYCVCPSEPQGFDETPQEGALRAIMTNVLQPALAGGVSHLTAPLVQAILNGVLSCRKAVTAYRAPLISACGDYDNEFSPLATAVGAVVDALGDALWKRSDARELLAGVDALTLQGTLTRYSVSDDGRLDQEGRTLAAWLEARHPVRPVRPTA